MHANNTTVADQAPDRAVEHDLSADELAAFLALTPKRRSAWQWVYLGNGRIYQPQVEHDGARITAASAAFLRGNDYRQREASPSEIVRAVFEAATHKHKRRSASAQRAAVTRAKHNADAVRAAAKALVLGLISRGTHCRCCGKALTDGTSLARGIGPECFDRVLGVVANANANADEREEQS